MQEIEVTLPKNTTLNSSSLISLIAEQLGIPVEIIKIVDVTPTVIIIQLPSDVSLFPLSNSSLSLQIHVITHSSSSPISPVNEESPTQATGLTMGTLIGIVVGSVCVAFIIVVALIVIGVITLKRSSKHKDPPLTALDSSPSMSLSEMGTAGHLTSSHADQSLFNTPVCNDTLSSDTGFTIGASGFPLSNQSTAINNSQ